MMNIQNEVQKIHNQYGISEVANYKIQLLCEQYAKDYHDSEVKKLNIPAVVGRSEQCAHPIDKREYIGSNMLRCKVCGKEFS